jgi:hypothetical protein
MLISTAHITEDNLKAKNVVRLSIIGEGTLAPKLTISKDDGTDEILFGLERIEEYIKNFNN